MSKIAIICEEFKESKFKEVLDSKNIKYTIESFSPKVILFTCFSEQDIIKPIVDDVTQFFIDKYKNQN